jgi:plasmid stabilization system protein ParE
VRLRFTPTARAQFLAALEYIRRDRPSAASRFRIRVANVLKRLADHPNSGRVLPEFPDLPYREVVVPPYRFFYRAGKGTVWIVAVWHGARLPRRPDPDAAA